MKDLERPKMKDNSSDNSYDKKNRAEMVKKGVAGRLRRSIVMSIAVRL